MYPITLAIHNIVRWIVLILGVLAAARALSGWFGRRAWTETDRKTGAFFGMALDIQFLLGLLLYFLLSPITTAALRNFGAAMSNPVARFFALEHVLYMVIAIVLAHMGSALARRAASDQIKFRTASIFFSLSIVAILLGMPWMRPLFPGL
jgi:hypothetical protein